MESPLQALGAVEAFFEGVLGSNVTVHGRRGLEPVRRTIEELERIAQAPGLTFDRESSRLPRRSPRRPGVLVLGDALSGVSQRFVLRPGTREVVLLDDGRATRVVLQHLVEGSPMLRPQSQHGPARTTLARLVSARLGRIAREGGLTVFTAVQVDPGLTDAATDAGVLIRAHEFSWLRAQPQPDPPATQVVILGSALVANNLIAEGPYLQWVSRIVRDSERVTYCAHRREDDRTLAVLNGTPGVTVLSGDRPVELRLRGLAPQNVVHTLPSTAAHTLRLICPDARIVEHAIPANWWRPEVGHTVRHHLSGGSQALSDTESEEWAPDDSVSSSGRPS